MSRVIISPT